MSIFAFLGSILVLIGMILATVLAYTFYISDMQYKTKVVCTATLISGIICSAAAGAIINHFYTISMFLAIHG